jgi:hypothetical protein
MSEVVSGSNLTTIVLNEDEVAALSEIVAEAIGRTNKYDVLWELQQAIEKEEK